MPKAVDPYLVRDLLQRGRVRLRWTAEFIQREAPDHSERGEGLRSASGWYALARDVASLDILVAIPMPDGPTARRIAAQLQPFATEPAPSTLLGYLVVTGGEPGTPTSLAGPVTIHPTIQAARKARDAANASAPGEAAPWRVAEVHNAVVQEDDPMAYVQAITNLAAGLGLPRDSSPGLVETMVRVHTARALGTDTPPNGYAHPE